MDRDEAESHALAVKAFGEESGARPLVRKARNLLQVMGRPVRWKEGKGAEPRLAGAGRRR